MDRTRVHRVDLRATFQGQLPFGWKAAWRRTRAVGYVTLTIGANSKQIIEVPGTRALRPSQRASAIADRFRTVARRDPLWWMKLTVGTVKGETVLTVPGWEWDIL